MRDLKTLLELVKESYKDFLLTDYCGLCFIVQRMEVLGEITREEERDINTHMLLTRPEETKSNISCWYWWFASDTESRISYLDMLIEKENN